MHGCTAGHELTRVCTPFTQVQALLLLLLQVESTFADGLGDGVERSFTKGVHVFGPNGDRFNF